MSFVVKDVYVFSNFAFFVPFVVRMLLFSHRFSPIATDHGIVFLALLTILVFFKFFMCFMVKITFLFIYNFAFFVSFVVNGFF